MSFQPPINGVKIKVTRNVEAISITNTNTSKITTTSIKEVSNYEYEVLETSDDIDYVSDRELELQSIYGYKVDRQSYKNLTQKKSNQIDQLIG